MAVLERMLFRSLRGNVVTHFAEVDATHRSYDPTTGRALEQTVALICFSGQLIRNRIERMCEALDVHVYPLPDTDVAQDAVFRKLEAECT